MAGEKDRACGHAIGSGLEYDDKIADIGARPTLSASRSSGVQSRPTTLTVSLGASLIGAD